MLNNIHTSSGQLKVHTNGGTQILNQIGQTKHFSEVWYNPSSLANILSIAVVRKRYRITIGTSIARVMNVHCNNGMIMVFREFETSLYYYDTSKDAFSVNSSKNKVIDYSFLGTIALNKAHYTQRELKGVDAARVVSQVKQTIPRQF